MPWYASDGFLWLTVAVGAFCAFHRIPDNLNHVRNLAACPEQNGPGPRKQLQRDAENAINVDTLRILSDSHSYDLRASTIKIVASRTVKSRTKKLLLNDLASKDEDRRYNAICAIWMLIYNPALQGRHIIDNFLDYDTFYAVITALSNVLASHDPRRGSHLSPSTQALYPEPKIPPSPVKPPVRPYHEMSLMMILPVLLNSPRPLHLIAEYPDNMTCALSAGLVHRWLRHYPFPCALPENAQYNFKKSDVAHLFERSWSNDDVVMAGIMNSISMSPMGKKHQRDAGLRRSNYTEIEDIENTVRRWRHVPTRLDSIDTDHDVRMTNGESTAGAATPPPVAMRRRPTNTHGDTLRARSQEISQEEEVLRRRRREAVVVAEAGAPLSQDNILQRTASGSAWRSLTDDSGLHDMAANTVASFPSFSTLQNVEPSRSSGDNREINANIQTPLLSSQPAPFLEPEQDFSLLMQPLIAERAALRSLQNDLSHRPDSDGDDFVNRINGMLERIRRHRDRVRDLLNQHSMPESDRASLLGQLDSAFEATTNVEQTETLLNIFRENETQSGGVDGDGSDQDVQQQ